MCSWLDSEATCVQLLGLHPQTGGEVTVAVGLYGPYVKSGDLNASLPKVIIAFQCHWS